jgi:hypothetical protein
VDKLSETKPLAVRSETSEISVAADIHALGVIDRKMSTASIQELEHLILIRAKVKSQEAGTKYLDMKFESELREQSHKHWKERAQLVGKLSLSTLAMATGLTLCLVSPLLVAPGLFMLGGGLYYAAPSFVTKNFRATLRSGDRNDDKD